MNIFETEPMVKDINQVHTTTDYFLFKSIEGNRNKNLLHINRLKKSMSENYLFTIIIVNEVHILNQNSKTWNADDYLDGYCRLKYPHYLKYAEFKEKYGFGHVECMTILSGYTSHRGGDRAKTFYEGAFKIKDYGKACEIAEKIEIIGQYYLGHKRRSFVFSMLVLFKSKNFEFTELIQKLKLQPTAMVDCTNVQQYIMLIEEIYNYRRREKVNLRY